MRRRAVARAITSTVVAAFLLTAGFLVVPKPSATEALSGAGFNPANIISDSVMFAGNAMSGPDVQALLNAKVPRCTLGDPGKPAGGIYTFPNGFQTLLATKCLKDYVETTPNLAGDQFCGPFTGGTLSAADIIARVGAACSINPKTLIVLLEKEQSLITDSFPATSQYAKATGFNCPDTAPCNAASAGFFKQVYSAARQLQVYGTSGFTWYPVGQVSQVRFHPNAACGSSAVRIENRATAALYYYTPYQPNAAALNNLYGTGDACSAYGNRNFWRIFTDWFGSTTETPGTTKFVTAVYNDVLGRSPDPGGLNYWVARLAAGTPRAAIADGFNYSDEYFTIKINEAYRGALNRDPDPDGFAYWMGELRRRALSPEDLYARFLHSQEMYLVQGGGTNVGYVTALYRTLLGRDPEPAGLADWTGRLASGQPLRAVSDGIWYSRERYNVRANEAFVKFLGRPAEPAAQEFWSSIARTQGPTAMRSGIIGSEEYWIRAGQRY